jgi:vacuolar-type H+-ATPase subunit E/Vma4
MSDGGAPGSGRDRLMVSLWQNARREAEQDLQKARAEADKLMEESRQFQEREMILSNEKARDEAMPQVSRIMNRAHNRVRKLILEGRYAFLDSCFDGVLGLTAGESVFRESVRSALPQMFKQALAVMNGRDDIEILLNPDDMDNGRALLKKTGFGFELVSDEEIYGGVMLRVKGGSMIVDNTIKGRLSALRETPPVDLLAMIGQNQDR